MRVLVLQTEGRLRACFENLAALEWLPRIGVYLMLGGDIQRDWAERPEDPWVVVGTQDQLLSRALNRGYAMSRFQWPVHFGLLNNDCRWVMDEVQLMGPALWTSAQLDWMRAERFGTLFPCPTTWMSATIGASFLETRDRKDAGMRLPATHTISEEDERSAGPRLAARRPVAPLRFPTRRGTAKEPPEAHIAKEVAAKHAPGTLSLVVCNTVARAQGIFSALPVGVPKVLLTSRFRPVDRRAGEETLYSFERKRKAARGEPISGDSGLVCVSTQVVEAGVDISAHRLWFEAAPWPAVIQRLGRLNRDGLDEEARAWYWGAIGAEGLKQATGPYDKADLNDALELLRELEPVSERLTARAALQSVANGALAEKARRALQPKPAPLPRASDAYALFSTDPDVHGGFTDVSPFVRGLDADADVTVFWRAWDRSPGVAGREALTGPAYEDSEGCPVSAGFLRQFLQQRRIPACIWNERSGAWERITASEVRPGMLLMLGADVGGYDRRLGWTGDPQDRLAGVPPPGRFRAEDDDPLCEQGAWVNLGDHLADARREAAGLVRALGLPADLCTAVEEADGQHDIGKAHPAWNGKLPVCPGSAGPWAKAPYQIQVMTARDTRPEVVASFLNEAGIGARCVEAFERDGETRFRYALARDLTRAEMKGIRALPSVRSVTRVPFRPGMRHEAASALAMWARYRSGAASYPALSVYLAASHHGKVRTFLRAWTPGGEDVCGVPREPAALPVRDQWDMDFDVAADGLAGRWAPDGFLPTDHGWTALVHDLLGPLQPGEAHSVGVVPPSEPRALGPFRLAYLEALVRVADWRASAQPSRSLKPDDDQVRSRESDAGGHDASRG
jgi:CRISPR-associated endonuclease/helicase Cas3